MRNIFYIFTFLMLSTSLLAQEYDHKKISLVGHWNKENIRYSSCWGYEQEGRSYAIVGGQDGTYIVDITDSSDFHLSDFVSSPIEDAIWREYKTYQNYLYAISDDNGPNVFQIIDLSYLPDSVHVVYQGNDLFVRGHTIFRDRDRLYIGLRRKTNGFNGMSVFDLSENPQSPKVIRSVEDDNIKANAHDMFARNDTIYASCGFDGLHVLVLEQDTFRQIGSYTDYPFAGYNHSSILSPNGKYLIFTDEVPQGLPAKCIDVSDPSNPVPVDTFFSQSGKATLHNPFLLDSRFFVMASYKDGVQVFDYSDPTNIKVVGYFDTYNQQDGSQTDGGYDGVWSTYPWLSDGRIIAVDMTNGLFVLNPAEALQTDSTNAVHFSPTVGKIKTSPNPASDYFTFSTPENITGEATLSILSMEGKVLKQWNANLSPQEVVRVNVQDLSAGNYLFSIKKQNKLTAVSRINITQ